MARTFLISLVVGIVYCVVTEGHAERVQSNAHPNEANLFRALLKSLANLNQDRLDTARKLTTLQDTDVHANMLRSDPDDDDDDDHDRRLLAVVLFNRTAESNPEHSHRSPVEIRTEKNEDINVKRESDRDITDENVTDEDASDDDETEEDDESEENTSPEEHTKGPKKDQDNLRMWKGCSKKAAKICKKACGSAHKNVCSRYHCSKRMKKAFKKECKLSCKDAFS